MNSKHFFKQLKAELHHPLRERFLEELEAHADDLEQEKLDQESWGKRMGEPSEVKNNFLKIMNPMGKLFFILEGLFFGILFIPFTFFIYLNSRSIVYNFFSEGYMYLDDAIWLIYAFSIICLIIVYFSAEQKFLELKNTTTYTKKVWHLLIFGPGFIALLLNFFFEATNENGISLDFLEFLVILLTYVLMNLLANYLALKAKSISLGKIESKVFKGIGGFLKISLALYFILSIAYRIAIIYSHSFLETWPPVSTIFSALFVVETQLGRVWAGLLSADFYHIGIFKTFYLPLLILLFIGVQSVWVLIKSKKWISFRSLILVYIASLFFITSTNFVNKPDFKMEAMNISSRMERNKVGVLYPLLKYFNSESGPLFKYAVATKDNKFFILNNSGEIFTLNLNEPINSSENLASQTNISKVSVSQEISEKLNSKLDIMVSMLNWPKDFECIRTYLGSP